MNWMLQDLLQVGGEDHDRFDAVPEAHAAHEEADAFLAGRDALEQGAFLAPAPILHSDQVFIHGLLEVLGGGAGHVDLERAAEHAVLVHGGVLGQQAEGGVVHDRDAGAEDQADHRHEGEDVGRGLLVHGAAPSRPAARAAFLPSR